MVVWVTYAHPLVRLPVFLIGVLGGLQVLRQHQHLSGFEDMNIDRNILHTILPWGCCRSGCVKEGIGEGKEKTKNIWKSRVDFCTKAYFGGLVCICIVTNRIALNYVYFIANIALQHLLVPIQFTIVVGLCMDSGESQASIFFRTKIMRFLGEISFPLYMLHVPIKKIFGLFFVYENIPRTPGTSLIVIIFAVTFSYTISKYVTQPITKLLKGTK